MADINAICGLIWENADPGSGRQWAAADLVRTFCGLNRDQNAAPASRSFGPETFRVYLHT